MTYTEMWWEAMRWLMPVLVPAALIDLALFGLAGLAVWVRRRG